MDMSVLRMSSPWLLQPLLDSTLFALPSLARPSTEVRPKRKSRRMLCRTDEYQRLSGRPATNFLESVFHCITFTLILSYSLFSKSLFYKYILKHNAHVILWNCHYKIYSKNGQNQKLFKIAFDFAHLFCIFPLKTVRHAACTLRRKSNFPSYKCLLIFIGHPCGTETPPTIYNGLLFLPPREGHP